MQEFRLVLGDWSDDGHGKCDSFFYRIHWCTEAMEAAHAKGCATLGFDPHSKFCKDYEDSLVPIEEFEKLKAHGVLNDKDLEEIDIETDVAADYPGASFHPQAWANLYMAIAALGEPNFTYVQTIPKNKVRIGGYGFYY